jgi:hypothetical protein
MAQEANVFIYIIIRDTTGTPVLYSGKTSGHGSVRMLMFLLEEYNEVYYIVAALRERSDEGRCVPWPRALRMQETDSDR